MAQPNLTEHAQALIDELAYWRREPPEFQTPQLTADERQEFLMQDRARRRIAEEGCRQEIADATEVLRQGGFIGEKSDIDNLVEAYLHLPGETA